MKRYYYISDNLPDLQSVKAELEQRGINALQIHVLSHSDAAVEQHRLPDVIFMKKDLVRSAVLGAVMGVLALMAVLLVAHFTGAVESHVGWAPFIFLAIVMLGFFTWEGGFRGIQEPNQRFLRFQQVLQEGKHIFFVDVRSDQEDALRAVAAAHPLIKPAGSEKSGPDWFAKWQQKYSDAIKTLP